MAQTALGEMKFVFGRQYDDFSIVVVVVV